MKLSGQTIVLTGSSSGIGAEAARKLARLGATVCLLARREDQLEEVRASIIASGGVAHTYAVDLAERGVAYRWLVSSQPGADGRAPSLAPRGVEMLRRLDEARAVPPPGGVRWRLERRFWRVSRRGRGGS